MLQKILSILIIIQLTFAFVLQAQNNTQTYAFQGNKYEKINGDWHEINNSKKYKVINNKLAIQFSDSIKKSQIKSIKNQHGLKKIYKDPNDWYFYKFTPKKNSDIFDKANNIKSNGKIERVIISSYGRLNATPQDTYYTSQWFINKIYSSSINVNPVWDFQTGSSNIDVAILDAGIDMDHEDLDKNILPSKSSDFIDGDNIPEPSAEHGTLIGGIIAAETDNNQGVAGIAGGWNSNDGCNLQVYKVCEGYYNVDPIALNDAIYTATQNNADIINMSLEVPGKDYLKAAIENAHDKRITIIASSGTGGHDNLDFPASSPFVIGVGGHNSDSPNDMRRLSKSNYGDKLLLSAPGENIYSTKNDDNYGSKTNYSYSGNSWSAGIVSGVAALMKSENPCLGPEQVKNILANTAKEINTSDYWYNKCWQPRTGFSEKMGYGQVEANEAVLKAQEVKKQNELDLFIKDRFEDLGLVLNNIDYWQMDNSPDIWVRNQQDGYDNQTHQNPFYSSSHKKAWVYVKVRNKSCIQSSSGANNLTLWWTSAATGSNFDADFDKITGQAKDITAIKPGDTRILKFEWNLPQTINQHDACLLAVIDGNDDTDKTPLPEVGEWVKYDNNVAMKNLNIAKTTDAREWNGMEVPAGSPFYVGNYYDSEKEYNLVFGHTVQNNSNMLEQAEINIFVKQEFWDIVDNSPNIEFNGIEEIDENQLRVTDADASIDRLNFNPQQRTQIYTGFNFYSERAEDVDTTFYYGVNQLKFTDGIWSGSMGYKIIKEARDEFDADGGGDVTTFSGTKASLSGKQINEPATYNWYNMNDSLLSKTTSLSMTPKASGEYVYEVTAKSDGFKDYDSVFVKVNPYKIKSLSPNPASSSLNVEYIADKANSAKLVIQMTSNPKVKYVYSVDPKLSKFTVNVSNFQTATYNVNLICDGKQVDSKKLIIQ